MSEEGHLPMFVNKATREGNSIYGYDAVQTITLIPHPSTSVDEKVAQSIAHVQNGAVTVTNLFLWRNGFENCILLEETRLNTDSDIQTLVPLGHHYYSSTRYQTSHDVMSTILRDLRIEPSDTDFICHVNDADAGILLCRRLTCVGVYVHWLDKLPPKSGFVIVPLSRIKMLVDGEISCISKDGECELNLCHRMGRLLYTCMQLSTFKDFVLRRSQLHTKK